MKIKCQYHGSGMTDYFDHVVGFYYTNNGTLMIVFEEGDSLDVGTPDYVGFEK